MFYTYHCQEQLNKKTHPQTVREHHWIGLLTYTQIHKGYEFERAETLLFHIKAFIL